MSDRIGGNRPPGAPPDLQRPADDAATTDAAHKGGAAKGKAATAQPGAQDTVDKFERNAKVGAQLAPEVLQALQGKNATAPKIQFSNDDIAYLAGMFAAIVSQNPQADRLKRAKLFARAILKRKRLRKAFAGVSEAEMEQMCDDIGSVLDSSPVFGQLIDNVTEGAGKMNAG